MKTYLLNSWHGSGRVICLVREESEEKARKYATKESPHINENAWDVICIDEMKPNYLTILG